MIFASGMGSRLFPLTKELPKSLLDINGKSILDIALSHLVACGIKEVVITTGYQAKKIDQHLVGKYPGIKITFVENKQYDSTNYIYSMWLARSFIDGPLLLMHGDMVFERALLARLINSQFTDAVLVNSKKQAPGKDFKAKIINNSITQISTQLRGKNTYFCAPIYKLSSTSCCRWLNQIELYVKKNELTCYAEDAFNQIAHEIMLRPVYYEDEFCMEIDTLDDLKIAEKYYREKQINS